MTPCSQASTSQPIFQPQSACQSCPIKSTPFLYSDSHLNNCMYVQYCTVQYNMCQNTFSSLMTRKFAIICSVCQGLLCYLKPLYLLSSIQVLCHRLGTQTERPCSFAVYELTNESKVYFSNACSTHPHMLNYVIQSILLALGRRTKI